MKPFYLYKRNDRSTYYVRFLDVKSGTYTPAKSIKTISKLLGDKVHIGKIDKVTALDISFRAFNKKIWLKKEKQSSNKKVKKDHPILFAQYVNDFWIFETSPYVLLKNKIKANSIGKEHCSNMQGAFRKNALPYLPKDLKLKDVSVKILKDLIVYLIKEGSLASATINKVIQSFSVPLADAFDNNLIKENPALRIKKLQPNEKERNIPTKEEIDKLLLYLATKAKQSIDDKKLYLAVALAVSTGMRQGEILALMPKNIIFENNAPFAFIKVEFSKSKSGIKCPKNRKIRHVPISIDLANHLLSLSNENPSDNKKYVFWSTVSSIEPLFSSTLRKYYYKALKAIGISEEERISRNIDFHSLRHFFNSYMRGVIPDTELQSIVGHASTAMTERYSHEIKENLIKAGAFTTSL